MGRAGNQRQFRSPIEQAPFLSLLAEARQAHDALFLEMAKFNDVTLGPLPGHASLATGRWRLSKASLQRRTLSARTIQFLCRRPDTAGSEAVGAFRAADCQMIKRSAEHVREWTVQAITADWAGYCRASREIRGHMSNHLSLEKELIFPLLEGPDGREA
ncbi:MAG: hypothetical protein LOX97_03915 [Sphingomonas sp.]|nr:hypothetical protein [Sphingomonas sp.]